MHTRASPLPSECATEPAPLRIASEMPALTRAICALFCAVEPAVDLSLHPPQPPSQTLLMANRLLSATAEQLNTFASAAEEKLIAMHHKMLRLETGVKLLEAKLGSLPGGVDAAAGVSSSAGPPPPAQPAAAAAAPPPPPPPEGAAVAAPSAAAPAEEVSTYVKCKDDPRFSKYFRMEKMGVPRPAVAIKLKQETGFDGSMLDTPDAPAPPGGGGGEGADDEVDSEDSD